MAIAQWLGNAQSVAQVVSGTLTATTNGALFNAQVGGKILTYTSSGSETTTQAAANFAALLGLNTSPPEFQPMNYASSGNVVTVTAATASVPFVITFSASSGGAITQATTTANGSPSDLTNPANWMRSGVPGILPQSGDDWMIEGVNVPDILWNLDKGVNFPPRSINRWQSFGATIGLPDWNPNGYYEYLPKYLKLGPASVSSPGSGPQLKIILGVGPLGNGPQRERYDVGATQTQLYVLSSGPPRDDNAVTFLGTNPANLINLQNASLGIAMNPSEVSSVSQIIVDGGGNLQVGLGVTVGSGLFINSSGSAYTLCAVPNIQISNGGQLTVGADGGTFPLVEAQGGSSVTWQCGGTIGDLILLTGSRFDKSGDLRPLTVQSATLDGDTSQVNDPNSTIAWPQGAMVQGQVVSGPVLTGPGRTWKIA